MEVCEIKGGGAHKHVSGVYSEEARSHPALRNLLFL